jgi:hypothetical protein
MAEQLSTRANVFVKLAGLIFIILGAILAFFTSTTPLLVQVSTVFYMISAILAFAGTVAIISKLE